MALFIKLRLKRQCPVKKSTYRAYLLRIWLEEGDPASWRMSLEEVGVAEQRLGFGGLPELSAYLHMLTSESSVQDDEADGFDSNSVNNSQ